MTEPDIRAADELANAERQRDAWKRRAIEAQTELVRIESQLPPSFRGWFLMCPVCGADVDSVSGGSDDLTFDPCEHRFVYAPEVAK